MFVFIKWLFPAPAPPVTNRLMGSTVSGFKQFKFFIVFLHHDRAMLYADLCFSLSDLALLRSISSDISVGCVYVLIAWDTCGLESDDDPTCRSEGDCSLNDSSGSVSCKF